MPRITMVTNRCDKCKAKTHRGEVDDSDSLEDGVEDTALPLWWTEVTIRVKQPNPEYAENEARIIREVNAQWRIAVQQATAANGGKALTSEEVEELKSMLEHQARGDDEVPEMVVEDTEVVLCPDCGSSVRDIGVEMQALVAHGNVPPWVVVPSAGAPAPVAVAVAAPAPALAVVPPLPPAPPPPLPFAPPPVPEELPPAPKRA